METAIISAAATVATPVVKMLVEELRSSVGKHIHLADIHSQLNRGLEKLLEIQSDKHMEVEREKLYKDSTAAYSGWTNHVSKIDKEVTSLNVKYNEVSGKTKVLRPKKRHDLKKKMRKAINEVIQLLEQCPENILVDKPPETIIKENGVPSIGDRYPTLKKALEDILTLLQNDAVKCVALHGGKGVGKTTIMQNLNNCLYDSVDKSFDVVIFIKVPSDEQSDLQILQKIAHRIKVDTKGNASEVAGRIQKILENKKYLLILDGVRHPIDGIWDCLDISKDKNGSKVIIATHHHHPAYKSKCVNRKVKVEKLSPTEAWKMFRDIVGDNHLLDVPTARLICKRFCSCLPLLIDRIAKSFKYQLSPPDWQKALNEFMPWPQVGIENLEELYSYLKVCYDQLKDEKKQKCFLYASLYPVDSKIYTDYLVECCIAQGFLGNVDATTKYSDGRCQGINTILKHLINVSFLEEGEQMRYVKMNDCNRQFAFHLLSKYSECRSYVDNEECEEPLRSESWQDATWVSMIGSKRDNLPTKQDCTKLQTLLLQKNLRLVEIPPAYFDSMCNLLVLNLYGTRIRQLPSLSGLTGLKVFYLNGCSDLTMSPSEIQPLQHLEVFDSRGTRVNFVPCLKSLRCLRISYIVSCDENGDQGNYHAISELHKLEELVIEVKSLDQWCNHAEYIIQEVASLEHLTTFQCSFPSLETLGKFIKTRKSRRGKKKFTSFQFFVECESSKHQKIIELFDYRVSKYVKYCNGDRKYDLAITEILPQAEAFELICHKNVENILELVNNTSSLEYLRGLLIERCSQISTFVAGDMVCNAVNGTLPEDASLLPNLEKLYLDNLLHLKCIFRGPLPHGSFSTLHTLTLNYCPELKSIFSKVAFEDFHELQKLVVRNCSEIEVLIMVKDVAERAQSILPKLKVVILDNLLNLKSICPDENLAWRALEQLNVHKCPELNSLPFNSSNASQLGTIEGEKEWWSNLKWSDDEVRKRFESAFSAST